jgi:hypothetical protein
MFAGSSCSVSQLDLSKAGSVPGREGATPGASIAHSVESKHKL